MKHSRRYARFDPVTVRAAARVVRLADAGRVPSGEVGYYLRELAAMEPLAGAGAFRRLRRLALRREAVGHTGAVVPGGQRLRRVPSCIRRRAHDCPAS